MSITASPPAGTKPASSPGLIAAAVLCFAAALVILAAAGLPQRGEASEVVVGGIEFAPEPGWLAPPFSLASPDGEAVSLLALRGRPVVVNFWATWCGPCAIEMPELQRLHEVYRDQVALIGVNTGESADAVRAWADQRGIGFPLGLDSDGAVAALYQLRGQPTTFVLNAGGQIVDIIYGPTTFEGLSRTLQPFLNDAEA